MKRVPLTVLLAAALAGLAVVAGWPSGRASAGAAASVRPLTAPDQPPWPVPDDVAGRPDGEHLLVRFRAAAGAEERAAVHRENHGQVETKLRPERVEVVQIAPTDSVGEALARYRDDPEVLFAEPNRRVSIAATPNDPFFKRATGIDLWGLDNTGQSGGRPDADVDAPEAWDRLALGGVPWPTADFAVGVVDTGSTRGTRTWPARRSPAARRPRPSAR